MIRRLLAYLGIFLVSLNAFGTDYWVSPSGSGTGLTQGSPSNFSSIQSIISGATAADVYVLDGVYGSVLWTRDGGVSTPIRVLSLNPFGARMSNNATVNVQVGTSGNPVTYFTWGIIGHGFEVTTAGGKTIPQCGGIYFWGQNGLVEGNWVHDIAAPGTIQGGACGANTGGAGIAFPQGGTTMANDINHDNVANANYVDNVGSGIDTGCNNQHGIYVASPRQTITNNIVFHSCGEGIHVYHATTREAVSNNVVMYNNAGGIQNVADSATGGCNDNSTVNNNVVANNGGRFSAFSVGGIAEGGAGCDGPNNRYNNNYLYNNGGGDWIFTQGPCTLATCGSGNVSMNASQFAALFVNNNQNAKTGDYHLKAGAAPIGKGSTSIAPGGLTPFSPTADIAGITRTAPYDGGVYKFGGGSGGTPPSAPTSLNGVVQ